MSMSVPGDSCRTPRGCNPCNTPNTGCIVRVPGECAYYSGSNLSGPGINTGDTFNTVVNKLTTYITAGPGTVTSVAASITSGAISIAGSPITSSGTLAFTYTGTTSQYIRGDGSLATLPVINTIYTANDTIVSDRTVDMTNRKLLFVAPNNTVGFGLATSQFSIGLSTDHIDPTGIQKSATISVRQKYNSANQNPSIMSASAPETVSPNGVWFYLFGNANRVRPQYWYQSNYGEANTDDVALQIRGYIREITANDTIFLFNAIKSPGINFGTVLTPCSNEATVLVSFENGAGGGGANTSTKSRFYVRISGDTHIRGSLYLKTSYVAVNTTLALTSHRYVNTGGAITLTLPDPVAYPDREHQIINMGTAQISFDRSIFLDATTSVSALDFVFPDNKINIISDGTKWIGYR